jgi:hypothetical protein
MNVEGKKIKKNFGKTGKNKKNDKKIDGCVDRSDLMEERCKLHKYRIVQY